MIRRLRTEDAEACAGIVRALPDYFTDDVPDKVIAEITRIPGGAGHEGWAIAETDRPFGFALVERRPPGAAEITWAAMARDRRNSGFGTRLIEHVLAELAADGVSVVEVKTLDDSAGYEPYEATRAFWRRRGFVQIDTIDPLPDWQPGNPAAICVAALHPTTPHPTITGKGFPGETAGR